MRIFSGCANFGWRATLQVAATIEREAASEESGRGWPIPRFCGLQGRAPLVAAAPRGVHLCFD